jgi:Xaa-Pro aminopeptidase
MSNASSATAWETPAFISAKRTPSMTLDDTVGQVDMRALRTYRLGRLQAELRRHDYAAALLFDPINLRYATGSRNMAVWLLHNPARYCLVPAEGKVVLFEYGNPNCQGRANRDRAPSAEGSSSWVSVGQAGNRSRQSRGAIRDLLESAADPAARFAIGKSQESGGRNSNR